MKSQHLLDGKINYITEGLINNKFPDDWGVACQFSEKICDELERNFFNNNCLNIFYFNIFIKEILPEDLVIYISKIFFDLYINNVKLEEATEPALDYFADCILQMKLNFFVNKGFVLNAECYTSNRNIIENNALLSVEETYKYLKIILNLGVRIYDIYCLDIFEIEYNKNMLRQTQIRKII